MHGCPFREIISTRTLHRIHICVLCACMSDAIETTIDGSGTQTRSLIFEDQSKQTVAAAAAAKRKYRKDDTIHSQPLPHYLKSCVGVSEWRWERTWWQWHSQTVIDMVITWQTKYTRNMRVCVCVWSLAACRQNECDGKKYYKIFLHMK